MSHYKTLRKGFTALELILVIGFLAMISPTLFNLLTSIKSNSSRKITNEKISVIQEVVKRIYMINLQEVENNCAGWSDLACSQLSLTPSIISTTKLGINTKSTAVIKTLKDIGCSVTGTNPQYQVECFDGKGQNLNFAGINLHVPNTLYSSVYANNLPRLDINSTDGRTRSVNFSDETSYSLSHSTQKLNDIGNAIKSFTRIAKMREVNNVCSDVATSAQNPQGGLASFDDVLIPWVWKITASNPNDICSGIQDTSTNCGCSSATVLNWETDSQYCSIDTDTELTRVLGNLGLGNLYRTDGFGNRITIVPMSDANGNSVSCPPSAPSPLYVNTPMQGKVRIGAYNGVTWFTYIDVYSE